MVVGPYLILGLLFILGIRFIIHVIAEIARKAGANVPFLRSAENANDFASTADVIEEVITAYEENGDIYSYVCCIYPTAPFVTAERLEEAMKLLKNKSVDSVVPVVAFSYPIQRGFLIQEDKLKMKWPEYMQARSQELECVYHDSGQFYCLNIESFLREKKLFMKNTIPIILSELEVQDIDTIDDWNLAEQKYRYLYS
jgi:N-acylneuraminate cytidylyltransferase